MLTILKIEDKQKISAYVNKHNLAMPVEPCQYMAMSEADTLCGLGALSLVGDKVYMNFLHTEMGGMQNHGLAKALLNMADLHGIQTVYGSNTDLEELYTLLRFQKENDEFFLSLKGYFTAARNC